MVRVKICGNTNLEDIELAAQLGADYVGVIVDVPVDTPRNIDSEKAATIFEELPFTTVGVAVIMPQSIKEALDLYITLRPEFLQIHNNVEPKFIHEIKINVPCNIIKTIHVEDEHSIKEAKRHQRWADAILLDTPSKTGGGSGKTLDWDIAREIVVALDKPVILAGGLTPNNVAEAIEAVKPFAVDVSSGVESQLGRKDPEKLEKFIKIARSL
ncbi:MAG TPA: phosphoribosylanthranilate isomerase [Euryarchaeota archaeon]|nr:N-(5'-phosphoribosyl)anthranilate isomerase [archaeon BMS3Bbin15]HDL14875.1 phosphoribosylanthranilate isomerase [Euryarchaeota archaeon]